MSANQPPQSRVEKIIHSMVGDHVNLEPPQSRVEEDLLALKEVIEQGGGGGGTTDYNQLTNKPTINGVEVSGDKTSTDYGLQGNGQGTTYDSGDEEVVISGGSSGNTYDPGDEHVIIGGL